MNTDSEPRIGFTTSAALLFLCQPEYVEFFDSKKSTKTKDIYKSYCNEEKDYKEFCKEVLKIYDRIDSESSLYKDMADAMSSQIPNTTILIAPTLEALDSHKPHFVISFPLNNILPLVIL